MMIFTTFCHSPTLSTTWVVFQSPFQHDNDLLLEIVFLIPLPSVIESFINLRRDNALPDTGIPCENLICDLIISFKPFTIHD